MTLSYDLSIEISEQYDFNSESLSKIAQNTWVKHQWPLVYFIQNAKESIAYVGESTNALNRVKTHLSNSERKKLNKISIIGSDKFNKSATLDIESNLIQYITAEGTFKLQNLNFGLINHKYYQQGLYKNLFMEIWKKLIERKIITKSIEEIENSEIFKYSPYKSLNEDQYNSIVEILEGLSQNQSARIFISGSAGTGKTILATYLMKLLYSDIEFINVEELNEDEIKELVLVRKFREKYPQPKIGLVVAMTSLRETLQNVFRSIPGLKPTMILSPSDTFKLNEKYDLLIVDESHRLRQYKNISWRGEFKKKNAILNMGDDGTELDWILANSKNQIFFYDAAQSVKPSDVSHTNFDKLLSNKTTLKLELKSQMRVKSENNYIGFVDDLLHIKRKSLSKFQDTSYELLVFDSFRDLYERIEEKESSHKLCRIVAGYSWEWKSDPKKKYPDKNAIDIELEGIQLQWNQTDRDWIGHPKDPANPLLEVGCIHTVQGYDLNYTAVIFGNEIRYNPATKKIEIDSKNYFDKYGRIGANENELTDYIVNIYKTLMYRGIRGTYIYACNAELREYLKSHIELYAKKLPFRIIKDSELKAYVNAVPLLDISVAAGAFSDLQNHAGITWIELPFHVSSGANYFVCRVVGDSMNLKIPDGSYCLFEKYNEGSRNDKIVLVQSTSINDHEFGSGYTVKEYTSTKKGNDDEWEHETIILKPLSYNKAHKAIILTPDEMTNLKVIGIFKRVLYLKN